MRKFLIGILILFIALFAAYKILSSMPRYHLDKSTGIDMPQSVKSQPEYYAFGYQPALSYSEDRLPCAEQYSTKKALFGDLHIHTALSTDAFPDGTRTYPDDVYRFAKGEAIAVPGREARPARTMQLQRPLDFAAVTDHAETFGEGHICRTPGTYPGYDSQACQTFRAGGEKGVRVFMVQNAKINPARKKKVCGENFADCLEADKIVWQETIRAAEDAYDRTPDCTFTSFVGYEYTRSTNSLHLHRNTIFLNADVPDRPATHESHPFAWLLLQSFEQDCRLGIENCDVISIPHNSNISGGNAFNPRALDGFSMETEAAYRRYRNAYDRLMEITQHKGTSECLNGVTDILGDVDELCDVEALRGFGQPERAIELNTYIPSISDTDSPECTDADFDPAHNLYKGFCLSSRDFARGALLYGMEAERVAGTNPFEFGFIGSSDTHISAAGATDEQNWDGHVAYETDLEGRLGQAGLGRFNRLVSNPGGLAGVYATENSRDAIFQSMKRREAFATSGPRIEPRFFVGNYETDICDSPDWLESAYQDGTPMGSKLPAQTGDIAFILQAKADPQSYPLEALQLVKGWIGPDGLKHNKVIDVQTADAGVNDLCAVYADPDYDPEVPSYYYMRAVETESPRWSALQCAALPHEKRPEFCKNDQPETIREMAWTSPIWLTPDYAPTLPVTPGGETDTDHEH